MATEPTYTLKTPDLLAARELAGALGISTTMAQVLLHRGVRDLASARDFTEPKLAGLTDPAGMIDRLPAADRLARAIRAKERIAVFGDYDVDGTTATTILTGILETLGADVVALAANRFDGGYGFSEPALARVKELGVRVLTEAEFQALL